MDAQLLDQVVSALDVAKTALRTVGFIAVISTFGAIGGMLLGGYFWGAHKTLYDLTRYDRSELRELRASYNILQRAHEHTAAQALSYRERISELEAAQNRSTPRVVDTNGELKVTRNPSLTGVQD